MRSRKEIVLSFVAFLLPFLIYLFTLCPTVSWGDSGEFISASYVLGISHPPGYPLYCLLGKAFSLIPHGSVAWRVNLMSAFFAALCCWLLYFLARAWGIHGPLALSSSLLFAFSRTFWSQAVVAEVYALNAFFLALLLLLLQAWGKDKREALLLLWAFLYGLSLCNHYTMLLLFPVFLALILLMGRREVFSLSLMMKMVLFASLGLSLYLYLPIRSLANPPLDWGDPETLSNFLYHVKRTQYTDLEFAEKISLFARLLFIKNFFKELSLQFTPYVLPLGLLGLFRLRREALVSFLGVFSLCSFGLIFLLHFPFTPLNMQRVEVYYIPCYLVFALAIGSGLALLYEYRPLRPIALALALFLPLLALRANYSLNDCSKETGAYDHGMNLLKSLPPDALLFCMEDNSLFPLLYLTKVEGQRPDVTMIDRTGNFSRDLYKFHLVPKKLINERTDEVEQRLILSHSGPSFYAEWKEMEGTDGLALIEEGIVYRVVKEGKRYEPRDDLWDLYSLNRLEAMEPSDGYSERSVAFKYLFRHGAHLARKGEREQAKALFEKAQTVAFDDENLLANLGSAYYRYGFYQEAMEVLQEVIRLNPLHFEATHDLALLYFMQEDSSLWPVALEYAQRALEVRPKDERAQALREVIEETLHGESSSYVRAKRHHFIALVFAQEEKVDEAIEEWQKALSLEPSFLLAHKNLASAYARKGQLQKALEHINQALTIDSEDEEAQKTKRLILEAMGKGSGIRGQ